MWWLKGRSRVEVWSELFMIRGSRPHVAYQNGWTNRDGPCNLFHCHASQMQRQGGKPLASNTHQTILPSAASWPHTRLTPSLVFAYPGRANLKLHTHHTLLTRYAIWVKSWAVRTNTPHWRRTLACPRSLKSWRCSGEMEWTRHCW